MKKKLLAVILAVASFAALAGCGSNGTTDQQLRAIAVQTRTLLLRLEQKASARVKSWASYMRWHWKMQVIP